jgi:large subunit ribosomal protein L4
MKVVNMAGKEVGEITLSDKVFGREVNEAVLHTAVRAYLLNQRQGTQSTLTRTEVSGGGRKPWKQKGTGRARQGSTRAPQWTHGGVALGPKPRSYRVNLNKSIKRTALFSALSAKVADSELIVIDAITVGEYKTKNMVEMLAAVGAGKKSLIVLPEVDAFVIKSCDNIEGVKTTQWNTLNVYDILNCNTLVVAKDAVAKIEEVYA